MKDLLLGIHDTVGTKNLIGCTTDGEISRDGFRIGSAVLGGIASDQIDFHIASAKNIYNGSGLQKDSGAIVVGAGIPPTNHMDYFGNDWSYLGFDRYSKIGVPRSRIFFSNYGKIVNVQAWG